LLHKLLLPHVTSQTYIKEKQWHYLLGTPDTSRNGRNTRKARSALTSNPAPFPPIEFPPSALVACSKIALKSLQKERGNNLWADSKAWAKQEQRSSSSHHPNYLTAL